MKLCNICKQPMDADVAFANLHNVCRTCLESGQDTECLNNPSVELSEWEKQHIRRCTKCNKRFVAAWYLSTQCGGCSKQSREKTEIRQIAYNLRLILQNVKAMHDTWLHMQKVIKYRERKRHTPRRSLSQPQSVKDIEQITNKRMDKYFGQLLKPFDISTLCRVMADKIPRFESRSKLDAYDILYKFFVEGYPVSSIALIHNTSCGPIDNIIRKHVYRVYHSKYRWLFRPVQRRPKDVKQQELNSRIADIIEAQSRISPTEQKE